MRYGSVTETRTVQKRPRQAAPRIGIFSTTRRHRRSGCRSVSGAGAGAFAGDGEALAPAGDGRALGILTDQLFEGGGGFGPALLGEEAFGLLGQGLGASVLSLLRADAGDAATTTAGAAAAGGAAATGAAGLGGGGAAAADAAGCARLTSWSAGDGGVGAGPPFRFGIARASSSGASDLSSTESKASFLIPGKGFGLSFSRRSCIC